MHRIQGLAFMPSQPYLTISLFSERFKGLSLGGLLLQGEGLGRGEQPRVHPHAAAVPAQGLRPLPDRHVIRTQKADLTPETAALQSAAFINDDRR